VEEKRWWWEKRRPVLAGSPMVVEMERRWRGDGEMEKMEKMELEMELKMVL
jgi:hypothetical protein